MKIVKDMKCSCDKIAFGLVIVFFVFMGCSSKPDADILAGETAKQYYDYLLEGKYEEWVDGHYQPERIPEGYRAQLVTNARMFMRQQQREHGGIREVRVVNAKADTASHRADVFMVFIYGDSTNEETLVPMVEDKGLWYLR